MLSFREFLNETSKTTRTTVKPKNKSELMKIIKDTIKKEGNNCDLNFIDTSAITDMTELFEDSKFNGDISKWDVSNVKDMSNMFKGSKFNGDISKWDVSNVKDMHEMFYDSPLEGNEPDWYDGSIY